MPIIEVEHLTKEYRLGAITGIKDNLTNAFNWVRRKPRVRRERFKALDDVNFTIEEGEVVGIIGHNGAGKSTLLKVLAQVTKPTSGKVAVKGSVAPLIEVGAGINPELTGRENIYLNASILGIPKKVIRRKLDEIIEFSELERFIDTPVKRYSSGMKVKLGFSIATSLDAEILIIDEVLAVGDLAFQRKCFDRMENLIKYQNKTVLLVSHNLRQVARMCNRAILLNQGKVQHDGDPDKVCNDFYEYNNQKILAQHKKQAQKFEHENDIIRLEKVEIINDYGQSTDRIISGDPLTVRVIFEIKKPIKKPEIVIGTHTTDFVYLTGNSTDLLPDWPDLNPGKHEIHCRWPVYPLKAGVYCIRMVVFDQFRGSIFSQENLIQFTVENQLESKEPPLRLLSLDCQWTLENTSRAKENKEPAIS
ncbi:MAG: ABC transporter ATP-binding protein [Methylohalobius sp. ZOD2]